MHGLHGLHVDTKAVAREFGRYTSPSSMRAARKSRKDVAVVCLYLDGDSGRFVTGQVIHVSG
jgi:hypothetical protein